MQASAALQPTQAPRWWLHDDDDDDDAPTLEFVVHHVDLAEDDEQAPALFAFELDRREAALTALMELAAADARADDDPETREFIVPQFSSADFDESQIEALLALDVDNRFDVAQADFEIEEIEIDIDESPPAPAVSAASESVMLAARAAAGPGMAIAPAQGVEWTHSTWMAVAALVFAVEVVLAVVLLSS